MRRETTNKEKDIIDIGAYIINRFGLKYIEDKEMFASVLNDLYDSGWRMALEPNDSDTYTWVIVCRPSKEDDPIYYDKDIFDVINSLMAKYIVVHYV